MPVKNEDGTVGAPPRVFLGHELAHAQDIKNGTDNRQASKAIDPDTGQAVLSNGEVKARVTENKIRSENGVKKRATPQDHNKLLLYALYTFIYLFIVSNLFECRP